MTAAEQHVERNEAALFPTAHLSAGLFTVEIERQTSLGATVRVVVEPVEGERVRVLSYERRPRGGNAWHKVDGEAGRVLPWAQLGAGVDFAAAFPAGGAAVEVEAPKRRRRGRR